ncbi:conserved hypothetical protein [Leishmania major strain Friedlin]|uniref:Uncharacterized protein n=1 Tax=Leishmania major TaxID=5664 RepID=Q4QEH8_LEIMA|nr:conserved hypothetical protein [Leishmania major strain Friedlin]CAG9572241.1 hypothetical_protein_-_conserved [Leishmania major strain Friedlin]CAJ03440.1 conserved hypothetical protein [Leishmania major strain Friedlin]|eukprot:XP_001682270.1 conserved hypothetical protein [Leishmania major strain Friedlin]
MVRYPIIASAPGDSSTQTSLPYGIGPSAAAKQSTYLPALLAAAQQTSPIAAKSGQSTFPSVPYYGILSRFEVRMDVSVERDARAPAWSISDAAGASAGMLLRNPTTATARMAHIQRRLYDVAERFGSVYHLSNGATLSESVMAPLLPHQGGASSAASFHSQLTYGAYVQALHDAFRRFRALRQACVTMEKGASGAGAATIGDGMTTHHTFYVRLLGHPSWKDLNALLCVEKGRLLVCLISSSRITQKHLTAVCADAGVSLAWLGGAALVAEPLQLIPGDVNPVWAVWDALVNLPLLSPSSINREGNEERLTSGADGAADTLDNASAGAREVLRRVTQTGSALSGFHISLISSMAFQGATRFHQVGRIAEEAPVFAQEERPSSSSLSATAAARQPTRQAIVARRYIWRLIPSPTSCLAVAPTSSSASALSCCAVLPFFISKLLQCLVEECGLIAFAVHCGGPAELTTHLGAPSGSTGSTASGAVGVRLVHSSAPSLLTLQQGPSSSSCLAFSRLSGAVWVDAETRESLSLGGLAAALGEPDKDAVGDEEDTEMEFEVVSIRYERHSELKTMEKEPNKVRVCATAASVESGGSCPVKRARFDAAGIDEEDHDDAFVRPAQWGSSFAFTVSVKRLITVDDIDA